MRVTLLLGALILGLCLTEGLASEEANTKACQSKIISCLREYLGHHEQSNIKTCVAAAFEEYGSDTCMPCLKHEEEDNFFMISGVTLTALSSGIFDVANSQGHCLIDCYETYLNDCDIESYAKCSRSCVPDTKDLMGMIFAEPERKPEAEDTKTEECQDAAIECLKEDFAHRNETELQTCFEDAFEKYGSYNCMPCLAHQTLLENGSADFLETSRADEQEIPMAIQTCVEGCYRDYMNDCSVSTYKQCATGCAKKEEQKHHMNYMIKPESEIKTDECQTTVINCLSTFYENHNEAKMKECMTSAYHKYGADVCMPCLRGEEMTMMAVSMEGSYSPRNTASSLNKECQLECYRDFMNTCNQAEELACSKDCSKSKSIPSFLDQDQQSTLSLDQFFGPP